MSRYPAFFANDEFVIDEKVAFLKFANNYRVYNGKGTEIGAIRQTVPGWHKFLRLFLNKAMMPFTLDILNLHDEVLATVSRGWTFWMSTVQILDENGQAIASLKQKFTMMKPRFHIFDTEGRKVADIQGNWTAWNFTITDDKGKEIGTINKKWNGAMKEAFTTADKYHVSLKKSVEEDRRKVMVVATAISIDMILKELG